MFGLIGLCLGIIIVPWNRTFSEKNSEKALQRAEIVGYQLVELYREASKEPQSSLNQGRSPASMQSDASEIRTIGFMGQDPWGQPYHYRILSADQKKLRVLVWSSGADLTVQSADLEKEEVSIQEQPSFSGDDVGLVMTMSVQ